MTETETRAYVVIGMLAFMLCSLIGGFVNRSHLRKGISDRFVQFIGVAWLVAAAVILACMGLIDGVSGTILGSLAGYLFGMRKRDE